MTRLGAIALALTAGATFALGGLIAARGWLGAPGDASQDLVGRVFGEGREALSGSMMDRADLYFHGGLGHEDCPMHHEDAEEDEQHHHEHEHDGRIQLDDEEDHEEDYGGGWWRTLNHRLHPHGHVHLVGEREAREMLPWMWAAIKADPNNEDAYIATAYWLDSKLHRPEAAITVLDEGLGHAPNSPDLLLAKGRILYMHRDDQTHAIRLYRKALKAWLDQHDSPPEPGSDDGKDYFALCLHLGKALAAAGERREALTIFQEALRYSPNPAALRQRIRELQARLKESG